MDFIEKAKKRIEGFPVYRRAPRVILEPPVEQIDILKPGKKATMSKSSIIQIIITPITMLLSSILMGIFLKRNMFMMLGLLGTVVTSIFSVKRFFSEKKEKELSNKKREELYDKYLLDKRKELFENRCLEEKCYQYNSPRLNKIEEMINEYNSRIYEKSASDADFLSVTVGYYDSKINSTINYQKNELQLEKDVLEMEAEELIDEFLMVKDKPLNVDLARTNLGLVGSKVVIHEQLQVLLAKICFSRSYLDLEIVFLINHDDLEKFRYVQWYPHCQIEAIGTSGIIHNGDMADQILLSMHKIIKSRALEAEDNSNKKINYKPHYIFIIDDTSLINEHVIMEYLSKDVNYGYSLIYTSNMLENLPENVQTVIKYVNDDEGILAVDNKIHSEIKFHLDRAQNVNFEWMARNLSVLKHEQGRVTHLPQSVSFLEMYKASTPEQLNIVELWSKNMTNKSLAVPLGIRSTGEVMLLNLHEKAHGPHGLIAGTTGSGKSEIIQSYILSLAVNFHPYDVGFLLIDYKGGGMANLFKKLPHVLGTITNLDAGESMRALESIKSELARRQIIFAENNVNHINDYTKLFKAGQVKEPLPHLFLISDEFAELKKEQPDFMTELVSTARLGRSLGMHLILATQKPSGVVTDQIWSNSRFKLALKVQDESDSREIIKSSDAAYIREPGRAYLQVGNNEIYELFQSAYSGAVYNENEEAVDDRVYIRNFLGQMELINDDLDKGNQNGSSKLSQLDVVVDYINDLYSKMNCEPVKKPWYPSLKEQIVSPYIEEKIKRVKNNIDIYENVDMVQLKAEIGMIDLPKKQKQEVFEHDFRKDGNIVAIAANGYGKSMLIKTMLLSLAVKAPASLLNYYIIDLGNASLIPLKELPHCADYINYDDEEKIIRFMQIFSEEIKVRKKKIADESAMNIDMYNRLSQDKMPVIIVVIDNYDAMKDINPDFDSFFSMLTREGNNVGIFSIITGSRAGVFRSAILNNMKTKLSFFMYDEVEIRSFIGKTQYGVKDIKGRMYIKKDDVSEVQIFTTNDISNEEVYIDTLKQYVSVINKNYKGKRPNNIRIMPRELTFDLFDKDIKSYCDNKADLLVPIGLNTEDVMPALIDLSNKMQLVVGGALSGKTNLLKVIIKEISNNIKTYVIDDHNLELKSVSSRENVIHVSSKDDYIRFFDDIRGIVSERKASYQKVVLEDSTVIPGEFYSRMPLVVIIIADLEGFTNNIGILNDETLWDLLVGLQEVNITLIASALATKLRGTDILTRSFKESVNGVITGNVSAQSVFSVPRSMTANEKPGVGYTIFKGRPCQIQIPLVE